MKKILTILIVLLWITSAWPDGMIYDTSSTTYLDVRFFHLDPDGEDKMTGWDSVIVTQSKHGSGTEFRKYRVTSGAASYRTSAGTDTSDYARFSTYNMSIRASNDAGDTGLYTYSLDVYGSTVETPFIGTYYVNDVGLGDFVNKYDLDTLRMWSGTHPDYKLINDEAVNYDSSFVVEKTGSPPDTVGTVFYWHIGKYKGAPPDSTTNTRWGE